MDTACRRLGELASGLQVWVDAVGGGNVTAGRMYNGRDSSRGFESGTHLAPSAVSLPP